MTVVGNGRVVSQGNAKTKYLTIPSALATDSNFPFEEGEQVKIIIDPQNKRLIAEKIR
ncbi:hypothetical protein Mpet_2027 [Methanolacinia petrolearia DSM 11571]|uniref:Uncharacterized protein n=1 Tax=Methanolacinia petrolearia (strain DSM 11571 / OCM 486 / SEBR 4847) TaxID=679926 RepID=E1RJG9_METP4|nr:hypothetical protein [Methanolacinia petrolearia]ADN36775.1 hypothetical protein Mpet_2027 [Methanolacinia petrolearia DSM 11571]